MFDDKDPSRIINYRPLLIAAAGVIAGTALCEAMLGLSLKEGWFIAAISALVVLTCAIAAYSFIKGKKAAFVFIAAFLIAFARMAVAAPAHIEAGEYDVSGVVSEISDTKTNVVTVSDVRLNGRRLDYKLKLTLSSQEEVLSVGCGIEARCYVSEPVKVFGSYNERLSLLSNGISVKGECASAEIVSRNRLPVKQWLLSVKEAIRNRIYYLFPENAPIAAGFLLGDRSGIDETDQDSFLATGTAHILSLSGFHVGILTAVLFFLLPKRSPLLRFTVIGLFLLCYCAITAFSASLVRASVMCMCFLLADLTRDRRDPLSSLSLAAIIILLVSPYKLWSVGFRLSFAASFGILLITAGGGYSSTNRIWRKLSSGLIVTAAATAATALISAQYFHTFPTYGILANAAVVPIFSAAITLSFAATLIGIPFPAAGKILAFAPDKLIGFAMLILQKIRALPYSQLNVISPSTLSGILMLLLMFAISPYILRPMKTRLKVFLGVFLVFTASVIADIIRA
ncbi:MAG: ComEC/Rec2 family competence protein [Clostridia bacterium]|nr:ComEC/Rec2 family competence protein [Clostridia bacterium]